MRRLRTGWAGGPCPRPAHPSFLELREVIPGKVLSPSPLGEASSSHLADGETEAQSGHGSQMDCPPACFLHVAWLSPSPQPSLQLRTRRAPPRVSQKTGTGHVGALRLSCGGWGKEAPSEFMILQPRKGGDQGWFPIPPSASVSPPGQRVDGGAGITPISLGCG